MYGATLIEVSGFMARPADINYSLNTNAAENSPLIDLVINASTQVCRHSGLPGKVRFIMVTFSWYYAPTFSYCCQGTGHGSTKYFLKWYVNLQNIREHPHMLHFSVQSTDLTSLYPLSIFSLFKKNSR